MSLHIYLAHSVLQKELPILWQLQADAAAVGVAMHLARYHPSASMTDSRSEKIRTSDALIAVVTSPSPSVEAEVLAATALGKPVIVYLLQGVPFSNPAGAQLLEISSGTTAPALLANIAERSKVIKMRGGDDKAIKALVAVAGIGALLLLIGLLAKD